MMSSFSVKRALYHLGIRAYTLAIHLAYPFHAKARLWVNGRKQVKDQIRSWRKNHPGKLCWIHAASLGEFEMAVPLMERMKAEEPSQNILLSFFSPSGYEVRKHHPLPDGIFYLPSDTPQHAAWWVEHVHPDKAIFIKYEIWLHYLFELQKKGIPTFLVNAVFRREQRFFRRNSLFLEGLKTFRHICVQYPDSEQLLREFGINRVSTTGDLRFDRVQQIAAGAQEISFIADFKANAPLIIGGSTWNKEEKLLAETLHSFPGWKLALFPHEFKGKRKKEMQETFAQYHPVFWSDKQAATVQSRVLIIDTIGFLSSAYQYADLALIGGGFSGKLHNVLEALAFAVPVITGPRTERFEEARFFEREGWLRRVKTSSELMNAMQTFLKPDPASKPPMPENITDQVWKLIGGD